jgi:hypothetical protein
MTETKPETRWQRLLREEREEEAREKREKEEQRKTMSTNGKDYPNSGIVFRSDRQRSEHDPGYTGNGDLTCPHCARRFQFFVNAWVKTARTGAKFFSLSFKPKDGGVARAQADDSDLDRAF